MTEEIFPKNKIIDDHQPLEMQDTRMETNLEQVRINDQDEDRKDLSSELQNLSSSFTSETSVVLTKRRSSIFKEKKKEVIPKKAQKKA